MLIVLNFVLAASSGPLTLKQALTQLDVLTSKQVIEVFGEATSQSGQVWQYSNDKFLGKFIIEDEKVKMGEIELLQPLSIQDFASVRVVYIKQNIVNAQFPIFRLFGDPLSGRIFGLTTDSKIGAFWMIEPWQDLQLPEPMVGLSKKINEQWIEKYSEKFLKSRIVAPGVVVSADVPIASNISLNSGSNGKVSADSTTAPGPIACGPELFLNELRSKREVLYKGPVVKMKVGGLSFEGKADEAEFLEAAFGKIPPSNIKTSTFCKSVFCALIEGFRSEEGALRAMVAYKRDGYVFSLDQEKNLLSKTEQVWTLDEIRVVDRVLRVLPDKFRHLPSLRYLIRAPAGAALAIDDRAPALSLPRIKLFDDLLAAGRIIFFDSAFGSTKQNSTDVVTELGLGGLTEVIVASELAKHFVISSKETGGRLENYREFSGFSEWKKDTKWNKGDDGRPIINETEKPVNDSLFLGGSVINNSLEDFAKSFGQFIFMPRELNSKANVKFQYFQTKIFDGKDFLELPLQIKKVLEEQQPIGEHLSQCIGSVKMAVNAWSSPVLPDKCGVLEKILVTQQDDCLVGIAELKAEYKSEVRRVWGEVQKELLRLNQEVGAIGKDCVKLFDFREKCPVDKWMATQFAKPSVYGKPMEQGFEALKATLTTVIDLQGKSKMSAEYAEEALESFGARTIFAGALTTLPVIDLEEPHFKEGSVMFSNKKYASFPHRAKLWFDAREAKFESEQKKNEIVESLILLKSKVFDPEIDTFKNEVLQKLKKTDCGWRDDVCKINRLGQIIQDWTPNSSEKEKAQLVELLKKL